ncbi:MAG: 16S rRNA (cytidine(1402)-2'-O)-methyltransferase [Firmicutes bacterium]|nr:16S rRNA (cytidine(1402)-2'-O)-methyltransferase [Bacillota bacterium]
MEARSRWGGAENGTGELLVCPTPIGNLEDITLRVLRVLEEVDLIASEDTRRTRALLTHFGIKSPLVSYHRRNEAERGAELVKAMLAGQRVALVSDSGMPGVSDPGGAMIRLAIEKGVRVTVLPGPTALVPALVASGLPAGRFAFEGFLPRRRGARRAYLEGARTEARTLIFFEAPHRLRESLEDMLAIMGDRKISAARELTKVHEEIFRGTVSEALAHFGEKPPRGEFVLVLGPPDEEKPAPDLPEPFPGGAEDNELLRQVRVLTAEGLSVNDAVRRVAGAHGVKKNRVYALVLESSGSDRL